MPVKMAFKGGKWRVVEQGGAIAKNKAGTSIDGGGHRNKKNALAQVGAVNSSLKRQGKI